MAYVTRNPKTKKELKALVESGARLEVFNPSGLFEPEKNGEEFVEGPHYPKPHRWYAKVEVKDGVIVRVIT